jgi:hypothetical protein
VVGPHGLPAAPCLWATAPKARTGTLPSIKAISNFTTDTSLKTNIMKKSQVKRTDYSLRPLGEMDVPAGVVHINLYQNAATFTAPPLSEVDFVALITTYSSRYSAYVDGGATAKAEFLQTEEELLNAMNSTALYVDSVAQGDRAIIILSGFVPTKETNTPKQQPTELQNVELTRGASGEILVSCDQQEGVEAYFCLLTASTPPPAWFNANEAGQVVFEDNRAGLSPEPGPDLQPMPMMGLNDDTPHGILDFTKGRKKKFMNLTPGTTYWVIMFGINTAGVGPVSLAKSIVCY